MCCFTGPVSHVSGTEIFARADASAQLLVYSMNVAADSEVAMVLPLPVPPGSPENAIRWIDLSGYPELFEHLNAMFPTWTFGPGLSANPAAPAPLEVFTVGSFEASFVPSPGDFARLEPRFRLSDSALAALPQYADWGFAVFKLRSIEAESPRTIHPMALRFPRRDPTALFFPTVHLHDGEVHARAHYDHHLYCQVRDPDATERLTGWDGCHGNYQDAVDLERAQGIIDPGLELVRLEVKGELANQDWIVALDEFEWRAGDS
jgi:hypothetical protein